MGGGWGGGVCCLFILIHFGSALKHAAVATSSAGREGSFAATMPETQSPGLPWLAAPGSLAQQSPSRERIQSRETRRF